MLIEIDVTLAWVIAIVFPILAVCIFVLVIPMLKKESNSTVHRYLAYLIKPPTIDDADSSWRRDKVKLYFYYLALVLFLVTFMIGEFYEVMFDLALPVSQGNTGDLRIASSVVFQGLFNAGWIGTLPWLGHITYHETWSWIFFTAAFTDNPQFLSSIIEVLFLISMGVGAVFLLPLASKRIRQSFLPSLFFFMSGMMIFTKAATGCFATGLALALGTKQIEFTSIVATGSMISGLWYVVGFGFIVVLGMFLLFIIIGRKLWKIFYPDSEFRKWFMVFITLSYWCGIIITMMLV